jgi:mRNA interferase RelE/StbE
MNIIFSKEPEKYLSKIDKLTVKRILLAIQKLTLVPPQGDIKQLKGTQNLYRLRVGDLRILFEIKDDILYIDKIAPRGAAYKIL